jgi:predicted outer membrane protein
MPDDTIGHSFFMMISAGVRSRILMTAGGIAAAVVLFIAATTGSTATAAGVLVPDSASLANKVVSEAGGDVALDSTAKPAAGVWLTDANVLALLGAINARQIEAADVLLQAWHSDTVRAFAAAMAREHAEIGRSVDSVAARLKLAPVPPAVTDTMTAPFRAAIDTLRGFRGSALDRAYLRQQIASHEAMARDVAQLGAVAQRPEVQALALAAGARIAAQAERAKTLDAEFVKADSVAAADSVAKVEARRAARRTRGR